MEVADQNVSPFKFQTQRWVGRTWRFLRSFRLTVGCLTTLAIVGALGWLLPQQSGVAAEGALWIARLPAWLQPWGDLLFLLDFHRLFQSLWWWGPVALLLLNSLIALADFWAYTRLRLGQTVPPISWQHPLAQRAEHVTRLPKSPDAFLNSLQDALRQQGFFVYRPAEEEQRLLGAVRRRWAWLGLPALYVGVVLLAAALLFSHYWLRTERLTLNPFEPESSRLLAGQLELREMQAGRPGGQMSFAGENSDRPERVLKWQLFQPGWFRGTLVLPIASEPVLTVEVRDAEGNYRRLIPIEEDLPPAERLNLPLSGAEERLIFLVPAAGLAVQLLPGPDLAEDEYNLQVRRDSESSPSVNRTVQAGVPVEVDDLAISLTQNRNLELLALDDPALPLYGLGLLLGLAGGLVVVWRPPVQVWLAPEVKGIGGRLYAVVERFGPAQREIELLEELLALKSNGKEEAGESSGAEAQETSPGED